MGRRLQTHGRVKRRFPALLKNPFPNPAVVICKFRLDQAGIQSAEAVLRAKGHTHPMRSLVRNWRYGSAHVFKARWISQIPFDFTNKLRMATAPCG